MTVAWCGLPTQRTPANPLQIRANKVAVDSPIPFSDTWIQNAYFKAICCGRQDHMRIPRPQQSTPGHPRQRGNYLHDPTPKKNGQGVSTVPAKGVVDRRGNIRAGLGELNSRINHSFLRSKKTLASKFAASRHSCGPPVSRASRTVCGYRAPPSELA